jgi:hypothetical protein
MMEQDMRLILGALALILAATGPGMAQTVTGPLNVTTIRTGWNADSFAIVTLQPIANPAHCALPDGYIALKPQPGYGTYYEAALVALQSNLRIQMSVDNAACIAGRPKMIGVNVLR